MIDRTTLSNGLTVIYRTTPQDPVAACHLFLSSGSVHDPEGKGGLTTLHWSLFTKGTTKRTARAVAEDVEMLGASMGAGATYDYSEGSCQTSSDQIQKALEIFAECLFNPAFDEKEILKERSALQAAIRSKKESIFSLTNEELAPRLYPNHPYGRPATGTEKSVEDLTRRDLLLRHKELVQPTGALLSMASDIPFKKIFPFLESLFGANAWPAGTHTPVKIESTQSPAAKADISLPSHFDQAYLMMGFPAAPANSPDSIPLKVLNSILGGGMSTRLFQTLREKEGLAYDVGSFYPTKKYGSAFVIHMGLQAARLKEAKHGILRELKKIQDEAPTETELTQTKNQMKGSFILDHQTNSQRAHYLGWWEIMGLGADFDQTYPSRIDRVSSADVHRVAQKYFSGPAITVETVPKAKTPAAEPVTHVA